ncbi:MAG TPA: hypothetical protein VFE07_07530 [Marmoricola sp.]|nr:hypothetical protein [Marmoricola sp.]
MVLNVGGTERSMTGGWLPRWSGGTHSAADSGERDQQEEEAAAG